MKSRNSSLRGIFYLLIILCLTATANAAKSVFAVINHTGDLIGAYDIVDDEITFQIDHVVPTASNKVIDITSDPGSEFLFITYEGENSIYLVNAKTMTNVGPIEAPGADDLAGIVFDNDRQKVYTVDRTTNYLFVYSWDADSKTLTLDGGDYIELEYGNAHGIALDEINDLLYVANTTTTVHCYNTNTWAHEQEITVAHNVMDIDIDVERNYLYTGGYGSHNFLVKTWLGDPGAPNTSDELNIGQGVIGLAVDPDSGLVYTTTFHNELRVYDVSTSPFTMTDSEDINAGAGVCVSDVSYKTPDKIGLVKEDDISPSCVVPEDVITYTITVEPNGYDHEWVDVIDHLPAGVTFVQDPNNIDFNYSYADHSYRWPRIEPPFLAGDIVLTLTVIVNHDANPGGELINVVSAESDVAYREDDVSTEVCCWGGDIIYVDDSAAGSKTGVSWTNAYVDLQDALDRIRETGCGNEVWVAGGTYSPGDDTTDTFTIPDGVSVFGGMGGYENPDIFDPNDRDVIKYKSILTGLNDSGQNEKVVTMGNKTKLHGFVVENAELHGIYGDDNFTVERSVIQNCDSRGIHCQNGNLTTNWCVIKNNDVDGIFNSGSGRWLRVNNCDIFDNGENGIFTYGGSTPVIKNSQIHHNGRSGSDYSGIRIEYPSQVPVIQNCTIFRNAGLGLYFESSSNEPDIYNCIFYNNHYYDRQVHAQFSSGLTAHYSSVTDVNDPNSSDCTLYGDHNMSCDPNFAYIDINDHNLHLDESSPCKNAGDETVVGAGELDIDGDDRIDVSSVDMGSDEVACTDEIANDLDFNGDGLVNYREFAMFSRAWLTSLGDPNYIERCDLYEDDEIDLYDIKELANDWAWQACWKHFDRGLAMMMAMGGGESMMMMPMAMDSMVIEAPAPEPTIEDRIEQTEYALDFFNEVLEDEELRQTIDLDNLQKVIDSLEDQIEELRGQLP